MSISARAERDVKRSNKKAVSPGEGVNPVVWVHRDAQGERQVFDPTAVTEDDIVGWLPMRQVGGSKLSSNIKVKVWCAVNSARGAQRSHELESGLEHDLHRRLDRPTVSTWLVPQPFQISLPTAGDHIPDLLQISGSGVTVWDCRSEDQQDDTFRKKSAETKDAAAAVGWQYSVFAGMSVCERLNLIQLNGSRRRREWTSKHTSTIQSAVSAESASMGDLFNLDDGTGELKSTLWHMIWCGEVKIDLTGKITPASMVSAP